MGMVCGHQVEKLLEERALQQDNNQEDAHICILENSIQFWWYNMEKEAIRFYHCVFLFSSTWDTLELS